jgi:ADP-ribose pyrophosphatase YjhB (NUDIX family)
MRVRKAARILLLNEENRILMFKIEDRFHNLIFWCTPGGGLEENESFEAGVRRELFEETGIREFELGPLVWTREKQGNFKGEMILSYEQYYVARVEGADVALDHMMADEREDYREHKWWSLEELRASEETFMPPGFIELLEPILAGEMPQRPVMIRR